MPNRPPVDDFPFSYLHEVFQLLAAGAPLEIALTDAAASFALSTLAVPQRHRTPAAARPKPARHPAKVPPTPSTSSPTAPPVLDLVAGPDGVYRLPPSSPRRPRRP